MTTILALETATDVCGVAAFQDGVCVANLESDQPRSHAAELVPMIRSCLEKASLQTSELSAIAISSGPGSYTGLRIGASTAKGLAFANDVPIVAVPTLKPFVYAVETSNGSFVISTLPSRQGEIYLSAYERRSEGNFVQRIPESTIRMDEFVECLKKADISHGTVVGPRAEDLVSILGQRSSFTCRNEPASAVRVGFCAIEAVENQIFEDTSDFEPYYLRSFVARKPARSIFDRLPL